MNSGKMPCAQIPHERCASCGFSFLLLMPVMLKHRKEKKMREFFAKYKIDRLCCVTYLLSYTPVYIKFIPTGLVLSGMTENSITRAQIASINAIPVYKFGSYSKINSSVVRNLVIDERYIANALKLMELLDDVTNAPTSDGGQ